MSILGSCLGRLGSFGCSPVGYAVRDVPLEEGNHISVRVSASLKQDWNQCAVREFLGSLCIRLLSVCER